MSYVRIYVETEDLDFLKTQYGKEIEEKFNFMPTPSQLIKIAIRTLRGKELKIQRRKKCWYIN